MGEQRVADLTVSEFKTLIAQVLDDRLKNGQQQQGAVESLQKEQKLQPAVGKRSLQEVFDSIDSHIWTPPNGTPSTLEMIREDRDR